MSDEDFAARRSALRSHVNELDRHSGGSRTDRAAFFDAVYETAGNDTAGVPWADLKPKDRLASWLAGNPGEGRRAVDVGCGLGDNAEAIAAVGWATTAFDLSPRAVDWARQRFPESSVDYRAGDLTDLPPQWAGAFDLVHECYTIQSVPGELRTRLSGRRLACRPRRDTAGLRALASRRRRCRWPALAIVAARSPYLC